MDVNNSFVIKAMLLCSDENMEPETKNTVLKKPKGTEKLKEESYFGLEPAFLHLALDVLDASDGVLRAQHIPQAVAGKYQHLVHVRIDLQHVHVGLRANVIIVFRVIVAPQVTWSKIVMRKECKSETPKGRMKRRKTVRRKTVKRKTRPSRPTMRPNGIKKA